MIWVQNIKGYCQREQGLYDSVQGYNITVDGDRVEDYELLLKIIAMIKWDAKNMVSFEIMSANILRIT